MRRSAKEAVIARPRGGHGVLDGHLAMTMRSVARSPAPALAPMASTTSIPDVDLAEDLNLPVSAGWSEGR